MLIGVRLTRAWTAKFSHPENCWLAQKTGETSQRFFYDQHDNILFHFGWKARKFKRKFGVASVAMARRRRERTIIGDATYVDSAKEPEPDREKPNGVRTTGARQMNAPEQNRNYKFMRLSLALFREKTFAYTKPLSFPLRAIHS